MIKLTLRKNLIYIIQLSIYYYIRRIDYIIIKQLYPFKDSLIFAFLMHLGEFFGGLASYLYQNTFLKKAKTTKNIWGLNLIQKSATMRRIDGKFKILLLIFFSAFFDFMEYVLVTFFVPYIVVLSPTADLRLTSIATISTSLISKYALKLKIGRHQIFSLIIIGICLSLVIIVEFIYQTQVAEFGKLFIAYILTMLSSVCIAFNDVIEKYLTEFNFINPFIILTTESIFGIIFVFLYSYSYQKDPFIEIKKFHDELDTGDFILLIFLLFLYFVFSAGTNVYKILANVFYSPMAKSVAIYLLNPFIIIYSYFYENDFLSKGEPNVLFLIINVILSIIIVFFGFLYNEFFILKCFRLEYETHYIISSRSVNETEMTELRTNDLLENDDDD